MWNDELKPVQPRSRSPRQSSGEPVTPPFSCGKVSIGRFLRMQPTTIPRDKAVLLYATYITAFDDK